MGKKVIATSCMPTRPPTWFTLAVLLVLDRYEASRDAWIVVFVVLGLVWVAVIVGMAREDSVNIFEGRGKADG